MYDSWRRSHRSTLESTLDGRPGWEFRFLQNGFHVNVSDGAERGRSSWAQFPEINAGPPMFNSYAERWTTYRLGPKPGVPYEGSRFDYSRYDQFMKQHVPRWTTSNDMVQAAYDEYFASMKEGMIVLAHSQGGLFSLKAALRHAENIRGVIMLESSSDLDVNQVDVTPFRDIPFLFLYGDFLGKEYCIDGYKWPGAFGLGRKHEKSSPQTSGAGRRQYMDGTAGPWDSWEYACPDDGGQ